MKIVFIIPVLIAGSISWGAGQFDEQFSGQGYGAAGCGLGSIMFGDRPGKLQMFASTTNSASFSNQTFGLSLGTSNCPENSFDSQKQAASFIKNNRLALKRDAARGGGETISTLSQMLKCRNPSVVGPEIQKNYNRLFWKDSVSSQKILQEIETSGQCVKDGAG